MSVKAKSYGPIFNFEIRNFTEIGEVASEKGGVVGKSDRCDL